MKQLTINWFAVLMTFAVLSGCSVFGGSQTEIPKDIPVTGKIEIDLQRTDRAVENIAEWATELKQANIIEKGSTLDRRIGEMLDKADRNMDEAWRLFELGNIDEADNTRESVRRTWLAIRRDLVQASKEGN